jgi:broad specificity phosphatase PhoE
VVARHAKAAFVESWFSDEGGTLTAEGREQAGRLADSLAGHRVAWVWTSDSSRAVQTAEIVAGRLGLTVTTRKALREINVGRLRGQPFSVAAIRPVTDRWYDGDLAASFDGGESGKDVASRYATTLAEVADAHRGETVLVVGHETAMCISLPTLATNLRPGFAREHGLGNGDFAELVADTDEWRAVNWAGLPL